MSSSAANEMQDEENDRDDDDEVNQPTGDVKDEEPAQPGDQQNDGKYRAASNFLPSQPLHLVYRFLSADDADKRR